MSFGTASAWQGRMAGMDDPYGLVQDESDMLIHPAMIMKSSGTRFYSHYRFTYTDVMDWDYDWTFSDPVKFDYDFKASGNEHKHQALLGSSFGLGSGRMGVFLTYEYLDGDYDGKIDQSGAAYPDFDFDLNSDKNNFTLSFLYGFPINCTDLGFEAGFAYRNEENKISQRLLGADAQNYLSYLFIFPVPPMADYWSNLFPYMIPYDSEYYEIFGKTSIASELGCSADFGLTINGSYIVSGDNEIKSYNESLMASYSKADMKGDVDGWSLGGDLWLRYKVNDAISLPFLVSTHYQKITRDGHDDGVYLVSGFTIPWDYEHTEIRWNIEAGGGIDIALDNTSKLASGIYYQYLENNNDFKLNVHLVGSFPENDMNDMPDYSEHRITLKFAYEKELSPIFGFRAGFDTFYGWADWDYRNNYSPSSAMNIREKISMDGDIWGIGLTLGGSIKLDPVTLEPFIGFAYQQTDLDGDGTYRGYGIPVTDTDIKGDMERNQWLITAGTSILF